MSSSTKEALGAALKKMMASIRQGGLRYRKPPWFKMAWERRKLSCMASMSKRVKSQYLSAPSELF